MHEREIPATYLEINPSQTRLWVGLGNKPMRISGCDRIVINTGTDPDNPQHSIEFQYDRTTFCYDLTTEELFIDYPIVDINARRN